MDPVLGHGLVARLLDLEQRLRVLERTRTPALLVPAVDTAWRTTTASGWADLLTVGPFNATGRVLTVRYADRASTGGTVQSRLVLRRAGQTDVVAHGTSAHGTTGEGVTHTAAVNLTELGATGTVTAVVQLLRSGGTDAAARLTTAATLSL